MAVESTVWTMIPHYNIINFSHPLTSPWYQPSCPHHPLPAQCGVHILIHHSLFNLLGLRHVHALPAQLEDHIEDVHLALQIKTLLDMIKLNLMI